MPPQKVLIVQLGRLGDFILATPMLRALKADNPGHQIYILASRHNQALARAHPLVDQVWVHSKKVGPIVELLFSLKQKRFDYWIDPKDHFSRESSFLARWAIADCKIGFNRAGEKAVFDVSVPPAKENYHDQVAIRNLRALQAFGVNDSDPRPCLFTESQFEKKLQEFLLRHQIRQYCCVHLSASKDIRYWPQANWISFLNQIGETARHYLITCDPRDSALALEIAANVSPAHYYPAGSIIELFSAIKHAELVISPDTSVVHIAAAFDRPLLGLYSNEEWNLKKFYPLSTHCRVVMGSQPGTLVCDIPLDLMLMKYRELSFEIFH
ncbi:MAG: glycosyltransferase family 9 protein [bacterium]